MINPNKNFIDQIWELNKIAHINYGRKADYIMIHPVFRKKLFDHARDNIDSPVDIQNKQVFSIKIIFTTEIKENDIIFTYNGYEKY